MSNQLGLYVHIPFCRHICTYCGFYKMIANDQKISEYIDYLIKEYRMVASERFFSSVYFGGGTPSRVNPVDLERLFQAMDETLQRANEITFEINPEDITPELLKVLKQHGINRLSIGIQSLNPVVQIEMNRSLSFDELHEKILLVKQFGFENFSFDLIYGFMKQDIKSIKQDLRACLKLKPHHLSFYSLIIEEHTILNHRYIHDDFIPMDEEKEAQTYFWIKKTLQKHGYVHYETSNFCLPGYESAHNLIYWTEEPYIGIGANSCSFYQNIRYQNPTTLQKYYRGIDTEMDYPEYTLITKEERMNEVILLGLRLIRGIDTDAFYNNFQIKIEEQFPAINELIAEKLLIKNKQYLAINPKYLYITNFIIKKIL